MNDTIENLEKTKEKLICELCVAETLFKGYKNRVEELEKRIEVL